MSCNISNYTIDCQRTAIAGINQILFGARNTFGRLIFNDQNILVDTQFDGIWHKIYTRPDSQFNQQSQRTPAVRWNLELSVNINWYDVGNNSARELFKLLLFKKDLIILFQTNRGDWFVYGEKFAPRAQHNSQFGQTGSDNATENITFQTAQLWPIKGASQQYVEEALENKSLCSLSWTEVCDLSWTDYCQLAW
jgi:hypothetical protein